MLRHQLPGLHVTAAARLDIFGSVSLPLSVLRDREEPKKALLMSRRTL